MNWIEQVSGLPFSSFMLAAVMTFGAAAIRGLTGFGMAILLVPLLGNIIRPDEAVVLAILLQLLIGPVGLSTILREGHRQSALLIAAAAVATTPIGIWALMHTPPDLARLIIAGIAIAAFFAVMLSGREQQTPGLAETLGTGLASGFLTGFAAMPGPPVVPYYLRGGFEPRTARASMMMVFFATAICGAMSAMLLGMADLRMAWLSIMLFVPMALGNWLGGLAFGRVSVPVWRGVVALLLGAAGVMALVRLIAAL